MAGFTPNEGETLIAQVLAGRTHVDRDSDLELGLFTNASVTEAITEALITEPSGGGYARIDLVDASWTVANGQMSYAEQTFTTTGTDYSANFYGYFIASKSVTGTQRILWIEVDPDGPYDHDVGATYRVTPKVTVA